MYHGRMTPTTPSTLFDPADPTSWPCEICASASRSRPWELRHTTEEHIDLVVEECRSEQRHGARSSRTLRALLPVLLERSGGHCEVVEVDMASHRYRCVSVGRHPHHILPRSRGGADTPDNLVLVCDHHHWLIHQDESWAQRMGYLR